MKLLPLLVVSLFAAAAPVFAQQPTPPGVPGAPTPGQNAVAQPMWRATLPGGSYEVALRAIISVSIHEYVVDNAARVTEVNIDTAGSSQVRFYYIEPNVPNAPGGVGAATVEKVTQMFQEGVERTGQSDVWRRVVKSYPTTTHARTVEFRLATKDALNKLFDSAESAFRLNKNTVFKGE
jgi:hypothetical protein